MAKVLWFKPKSPRETLFNSDQLGDIEWYAGHGTDSVQRLRIKTDRLSEALKPWK